MRPNSKYEPISLKYCFEMVQMTWTWPFMFTFAHEGSDLFLAVLISLPAKVPLSLATIRDGVAVSLIFQIHVNPCQFHQYLDNFQMMRILTGLNPGCLVSVTPSSLQTFHRPSSYIPCFPLNRPNWWPCKRKYATLYCIKLNPINYKPASQFFLQVTVSRPTNKSVDLLFTKMPFI